MAPLIFIKEGRLVVLAEFQINAIEQFLTLGQAGPGDLAGESLV